MGVNPHSVLCRAFLKSHLGPQPSRRVFPPQTLARITLRLLVTDSWVSCLEFHLVNLWSPQEFTYISSQVTAVLQVWVTDSSAGLVWLLGIMTNHWTIKPRGKSLLICVRWTAPDNLHDLWWRSWTAFHIKPLERLDTN